MIISAQGLSRRGPARDENQDAFAVGPFVENEGAMSLSLDLDSGSFLRFGLFVAVADGMGGHQGGALASRTTLEGLVGRFYSEPRPSGPVDELAAQVRGYLEAAHADLMAAATVEDSLRDCGTTLSGLVFAAPAKLVTFHVGDSSIFRARAGYTMKLTEDHSVVGPAVSVGEITVAQALAVQNGRALTKFFGPGQAANLDIEFTKSWMPKDAYLLCSDGLSGLGSGLTAEELGNVFISESGKISGPERIINAALSADGSDNATGVIVTIGSEEE